MKNLAAAEEQADMALELGGERWYALWNSGLIYFYQARFQEALKRARESADLMPSDRRPLALLARIYAALGQLDEADSHMSRAFEAGPVDAALYNVRGEILFRKNQPEEALMDINKGLDLDPYMLEGYTLRASVLRKLGRDGEAELDEKRGAGTEPLPPSR